MSAWHSFFHCINKESFSRYDGYSLGKKAVEGTAFAAMFETEKLGLFNRTTVKNCQAVRDNFNAVLTQAVTAFIPESVNLTFEKYIAEVRQVGYGDTAKFDIESNELFKVFPK